MKRTIFTFLVMLALEKAYALPLGNPIEASLHCDGVILKGPCYDFCEPGVGWCDAFSLRLGYYGDYVFNRHLEVDGGNNSQKGKEIEHASLYTYAAYAAMNFWDRLEFFAMLGASRFTIHTNASLFSGDEGDVTGNRLTLASGSDLSWGFGMRFTFGTKRSPTLFGIEGQYFYTEPHIQRISISDSESIYPGSFAKVKYHEWQIGFGMSQRIWNLIPYIGAKISGVQVDLGDANFLIGVDRIQLHDLKNRFEGGFVIGVSLLDRECASITIETRYPDEKAVYVNGMFRF